MWGDGEARQCHGQGTAARAPVGSPTPEFLPAWWLLRTVLCLLSHLMGTLQPSPCLSPPAAHGLGCHPGWDVTRTGMSHRLGCHTGSQQAGAVCLGGQDGGPSPVQGDTGRADSDQGVLGDRVTSVPALPHPLGLPSPKELQLRQLFLLPGFPQMLARRGWGKLWMPGFGVGTLLFAAQGVPGAFPGRGPAVGAVCAGF